MTERQLTEAQGRRSGGVAQSGDIKLKLSRFCVLARLRVQCSANPAASTHTQTQELPLAQTSPPPHPSLCQRSCTCSVWDNLRAARRSNPLAGQA